MKPFVIRIFLGLFLVALFCTAVAFVRLRLVRQEYEAYFMLEPSVDVVFTGDSVTGCSVDEAEEYRNRVLWRSSTPIIYSYMRLRELERLGQLRNVKYVATGICYHTLRGGHRELIEEVMPGSFALTWRYLDALPVGPASLPMLISTALAKDGLISTLSNEVPAETTPFMEREAAVRERVILEYLSSFNKEIVDERLVLNIEAIGAMAEICAKNGIALVVFSTPVYSEVLERLPGWLHERHDAFLDACRQRGAYCFDFRAAVPDIYFRDTMHIMPSGAEWFTPMLMQAIRSIGNGGMTFSAGMSD